ncbi:GmrSD restriction endonuclease domain-containing protein [Limisphaera sp. 4302-co]|uniref:GmrSD restriction endonuclease domain-containing protein n=1 Tax=Limisphaera sp. 4302-co TaxID=3400417 RepID=UPI003C24423B
MSDLLFKKVDYNIGKLLEDIAIGEIGLPDIQRPFVWDTARVRDLFDSMYLGYPIGTLLFWENGYPGEHRTIGVNGKQKVPDLLIVDGQQRLTALYAVMKGIPIVDRNFQQRRLRIAFNPLEGKFEVTNTAIERDPAWIPDISVLWQPDFDQYNFVSRFLDSLEARRGLTPEERKRIPQAIQRLVNLINYPMTALEISVNATEEQVSEIFVRINSRGRTLNQADFILTLMSVFWDEGRKQLEDFSREAKYPPADNRLSPYNPYFQPQPDQLLRVDVALAFRRARLEHVYSILRGKDLQTGEFSPERRDAQFALLREAQAEVLNLQHWHDFLKVIKRAGYIHPSLITSQTALVYTYALWLIAKRDFGLDQHTLRNLMARWFFMSSLTGRYTSSPETRMEQDLALLRGCSRPEEFVQVLEQEMAAVLTLDYWTVTLPNELATASHLNPGQAAFFATLCLLDAPVLYSCMRVRELLDPTSRGRKSALERHHLFPRKYLKRQRITDPRDIDQVANYALVEWHDNLDISDRPPAQYAPQYESRFTPEQLEEMHRYHALPEHWYQMDYPAFLEERRRRMAAIIREGFEQLR